MRLVLRLHPAIVPQVGTPVTFGVTIKSLSPMTNPGHADAIGVARYGRKITDHQYRRPALLHAVSAKREPAVVARITHQPAETGAVSIAAQKGAPLPIEPVQFCQPSLYAQMK